MENITIKDLINKLNHLDAIISVCRDKIDEDLRGEIIPTRITIDEEMVDDILMFLTEYKNLILNTKVEIEV